jgi:cell migration-inducing and hyaluronan-binding protein
VAYRTLAIHDLDGSTTGIPNSYVLLNDGENDSVATDSTCKIQPTWNASVCTGDVGRLNMGGGGGGLGARGGGAPRGAGAPRGPAPGGNNFVAQGPPAGAGRGGPVGPGAGAAAPRGGGAGGGAAAAQAPIVLSRNGKDFKITGNQSTLRAGTEIRVKTERPQVSFSLSEMNKDSWVIFELPGFAISGSGTKQDSLDALRKSSGTSYFKDKDALWVKVVVPADPEPPIRPTVSQTSVTVSR